MTERYPQTNDALIANMDTTPIPVRRFTAPGFDHDGTQKVDLNKVPQKVRRALHRSALSAMSVSEQRDELTTVLRDNTELTETQTSPDFHAEKLDVRAIRENMGLSAVRGTLKSELEQASMHIDGVKPGEISSDPRARREELMRHARKSKLV